MAAKRRAKGESPMVKTSIAIPDDLLQELKHQAVEERTDVSSLIRRIAQDYLKRKGGR